MSYISTFGIYFPHFRIADNVLHPKGRKNLHAIGYVDEDIITMAVAACRNLYSRDADLHDVDAILFATNTPIFKERYHASYLAELLGLEQGILAMDMGTTNRAGTDALLLADALVRSGKHNKILVVASEMRFPPIGQETRIPFGHGALAVVVSKDEGIAEIGNASSFSSALAEEFTYKGKQIQYDARFARTAGFKENMKRVMAGINRPDIDMLIVNSAYVKLIFGALKKAGFDLEKQVAPDKLLPVFGYMGAAHGLLRLLQAIVQGRNKITLVDYNNGSNVITVRAKGIAQPDTPFEDDPSTHEQITAYQDYLTIRKLGKFDGKGYERIEMFSSEMLSEREKEQLIRLNGFECLSCGTVYLQKSARCNNCKGMEFKSKKLSNTGKVYTLTAEHYYPAAFPPTNMVVIDLNGGGRITVQQTDDMYQSDAGKLQIGDEVELTLRKMIENDAKPNYFWKCVKSVEHLHNL